MQEDTVEQTTVDDVYEDQLARGAVVDDSQRLIDVVETLEFRDGLAAIYVVDPRERYTGVVTRGDLIGWIGTSLESPASRDAFPWGALSEALEGARAADAVNPRSREIPVEPRDPIERAVRNMLGANLPVLPVVAPDGSIEGELTLTRVLRYASEQGANRSR